MLIETTQMPFADVAFAAGFSSIRQFNDTVRTVYAATPSELRAARSPRGDGAGHVTLRIGVREPFAADALLAFLAKRAVPQVEEAGPGWYARTLRLPHGWGRVRLTPDTGTTAAVQCALQLGDLRDLAAAVERCRRLLDADCDPEAVDDHLGADPRLAPSVRRHPGLRVPGHVDGDELAVRAVLGQQISVARARTLAAMLLQQHGDPLPAGEGRLFPTTAALAALRPDDLPMPRARGRALVELCAALEAGDIVLDRSAEREDVRRKLLAIPGIGPWTADYVAMRALGDPDVLMAGDVGVRHGLRALGVDRTYLASPHDGSDGAVHPWAPWRSYAQMHVWAAATDELAPNAERDSRKRS